MPPVLAPLVVLAVAALVGRSASRLALRWTGRPLLAPTAALAGELAGGLALWTWVALALAEAGAFSVARVVAVLAATAAGLALAGRGRPALPDAASALAAVTIAIVATLAYRPAYDASTLASDATVYWNTGIRLARAGTLAIPDPVFAELDVAARAALVPLGATTGWTRMTGALVVDRGGVPVVWPGYGHALPAWIASFAGLGGPRAATWVGPTFAAVALLAVFTLARATLGVSAAVAATALVAVDAGQLFYARFLMPEVVGEALLWGGLVAFGEWRNGGTAAAAALAGVALGAAALTRVEYLLFLPLALGLWLALPGRPSRGLPAFALPFGALVLHGVAHLALVPTHYRDVAIARGAAVAAHPVAIAALAAAGVAAAVATRPRPHVRAALLAAIAIAAAGVALGSHAGTSVRGLRTLALATSWPVLVLAAVGLARVVRRADPRLALPLALFAVVTPTLLHDPHATATPLWVLRRFVPVTLPALAILTAAALPWRRAPALAAVVAAAAVVLVARPAIRLARLGVFPDQQAEIARLASLVPADGVVLFDGALADYAIHVPLWLVHGRETFVLPPWAPERALQAATAALSARHAVYYATADARPPAVDGVTLAPAGDVALRFVTPALDPDALPHATAVWPLDVRLYRVRERASDSSASIDAERAPP